MDFRDRADAGHQLAPLVRLAVAALPSPPGAVTVVARSPRGTQIGESVATNLGADLVTLEATDSASELPCARITGRLVVVVDDGVETGQAALGLWQALRPLAPAATWLAVPVCPRQSEAVLTRAYDKIVAIIRPLGRRSLRWHYQDY